MQQVDSEDANFLFQENADSPSHISLIALYDQSLREGGDIRFKQIRQLIENRLAAVPMFCQKIMRLPADIDFPYWIDDEHFDLDYHVRHLALPKPGDWRQFCIQVSRLHSRTLDIRRPLWEIYVIEGLERVEGLPPGSFALYLKIHHTAMDEYSAMELLENLHETTPNPHQHEAPRQPIAFLPARKPNTSQILVQATLNNTLSSMRLVRQLIASYRRIPRITARIGVALLGKIVHSMAPADKPATRFAGSLGSARVFDGIVLDRQLFDDLAARVPGATSAHTLMLICGEALRLYLGKTDEQSTAPLSALLHINLRNAGAHALAGNHVAVERIDLFTNIQNLIERLHAIVGGYSNFAGEEELEFLGMRLREFSENMPAPLLAMLDRSSNRQNRLLQQAQQKGDFGFAEFQGPQLPLFMLGAKLHACTSIRPLYVGCGLMFSANTYCKRIALTFTSDHSMMPDPKLMRDCIKEAIQCAHEQLNVKPARHGDAKKAKPLPGAQRRRTVAKKTPAGQRAIRVTQPLPLSSASS